MTKFRSNPVNILETDQIAIVTGILGAVVLSIYPRDLKPLTVVGSGF
jgi:hypothetical protein